MILYIIEEIDIYVPVHMCIHVDGFIDNYALRSLSQLIYWATWMNGHSLYAFLWSCYNYQISIHLIVKYFSSGNCRLVFGQPFIKELIKKNPKSLIQTGL